jgi:outer membrane lipopolysaccharide assembly protein LptE/RlpB
MRTATVLCIAVLLASCGFRLQGTAAYPESMANTYIAADDRFTPFYRKLSVALEQGGVNVTSSPIDADAVIRIENDDTGQRVLTVSGRNIPTEYQVYYSVRYSVWKNGSQIGKTRNLSDREDYSYDSTQVLGKAREAAQLQDALADRLVARVSRELSSID